MKKSSPNTILLVTRDRLVRADLRAGRTIGVTEINEEHHLAADDLPSQVEAALRLGKRRPGRVWILAGEIWTQTLGLAPESISGLSPNEVTRALGFEAEPFSGLGAMEAAMDAVPLAGEGRGTQYSGSRQFWLTELPASTARTDRVSRAAGGRAADGRQPPRRPAGGLGWRSGHILAARRTLAGSDHRGPKPLRRRGKRDGRQHRTEAGTLAQRRRRAGAAAGTGCELRIGPHATRAMRSMNLLVGLRTFFLRYPFPLRSSLFPPMRPPQPGRPLDPRAVLHRLGRCSRRHRMPPLPQIVPSRWPDVPAVRAGMISAVIGARRAGRLHRRPARSSTADPTA